MEVTELISGAAWVVDPLMTTEECDEVIQVCLAAGIKDRQAQGDKRHRNNFNHKFRDENLAEKLWNRLESLVPPEYIISVDDASIPPGFMHQSAQQMIGEWMPSGVNPHFSAMYYKAGGHFGPHRDSHVRINQHEQSVLTVAIYLNDRPQDAGGATHFLCDDLEVPQVDSTNRIRASESSIVAKVLADRAGKAAVFHHDLLHEGGTLTESAEPKWLLVTQVLYRRDAETAPKLSEAQILGRQLLEKAEEAEVNGDIPLAILLYNRAYKLDSSLDG